MGDLSMTKHSESLKKQQAEALDAAIAAFDGDSKHAESWLHQRIKALKDERPIDYMNSLERLKILRSVIAKLENGFP